VQTTTGAAALGVEAGQVRADGALALWVALPGSGGWEAREDAEVASSQPAPAPPPDAADPLRPRCPPVALLPRAEASVSAGGGASAVGRRVVEALAALGVEGCRVVTTTSGPAARVVVVRPPAGVRGSAVLRLDADLAVALGVPSVRLAPAEGRPGCIVVEVPRGADAEAVVLRGLLASRGAADAVRGAAVPMVIGAAASGEAVVADLAALPHLLVAGTTGSGKTVALHAMIVSMLLTMTPDDLRLILVDPKVTEFGVYAGLPHLLAPVISEVPATAAVVGWVAAEMDRRFAALARAGVQDIASLHASGAMEMPRLVIVADEVADVMLAGTREDRDSVQRALARILAKGRAAGIHAILATQRPTADVLPGLVKSNAPARLALAVQSDMDSRIILDRGGAEALQGHGDALYSAPGARAPQRVQVPWVPRNAVEAVVAWWRAHSEAEATADRGLLAALATAGMAGDAADATAAVIGGGAAPAAAAPWDPDA
jgi:S-DNA-T family DNA segregation ATPase FtsK/SpoIIIE